MLLIILGSTNTYDFFPTCIHDIDLSQGDIIHVSFIHC